MLSERTVKCHPGGRLETELFVIIKIAVGSPDMVTDVPGLPRTITITLI